MDKYVYKGFLNQDECGCLECGNSDLIDDISNDIKKGDKIFVRYYISNKKITEEEAQKALIAQTFGGDVEDIDFILDAYSEYKIMDYKEEFKVGGHDLYEELLDRKGNYLILIIEKQNA